MREREEGCMYNAIMRAVSSMLALGVIVWSYFEYADDRKIAVLITVWELLCIAAAFALFPPG